MIDYIDPQPNKLATIKVIKQIVSNNYAKIKYHCLYMLQKVVVEKVEKLILL